MKIKARGLEGAALDWAVAAVTGVHDDGEHAVMEIGMGRYAPSTDWSQGGPLIEKRRIKLTPITQEEPVVWHALTDDGEKLFSAPGPTPLVAAMRALVAMRLGDMVDVPDELTTCDA